MAYSIDTTTWRSPNHSDRAGAIGSIVVHSCEGTLPFPRSSSLPWLVNPASGVSCHYYVCRNAQIFQLVNDSEAAWHAGRALPQYQNDVSLGIECEHRSGQDWPAQQKDALASLLRLLMARHTIPLVFIDTHGQVALDGPYRRKIDPTNWPHNDFIQWRNALVAPPTKRYRTRRVMISQRQAGGAPYAGELQPGEEVVADKWYTDNGGTIHLQDGRGFVLLRDLEAV